MIRTEYETLVEYALDQGRQMMECGAESWRTEDMMSRLLRAYGMEVLDAHVMASQAAVSVKSPEGDHYSSTCAIRADKRGTNLRRMEEINAAARAVCNRTPAVEDLHLFNGVPSAGEWSGRELAGCALGVGAFTVLFGGTMMDCLLASVISVLIYAMNQFRRSHNQHHIIYTVMACFTVGMFAQIFAGLSPRIHLDMVMIGDVMLFVPGLDMANGVRELFYSDILTGIYRMTGAVLSAAAIAVGYMVALVIGGYLL